MKLLELKDRSFKICDIIWGLTENWNNYTDEQKCAIGDILSKAEDRKESAIIFYFYEVERILNKIGVSLFDENNAVRNFEYVLQDIRERMGSTI